MDSASPKQGKRDFIFRLCKFEKMKNELGENLALCPLRRTVKAG